MISSHITNKEASKQNVLYPIGYMVITVSISYTTSKYYVLYLYSIFSYKVVSLLPVLSEKHISILFSIYNTQIML